MDTPRKRTSPKSGEPRHEGHDGVTRREEVGTKTGTILVNLE